MDYDRHLKSLQSFGNEFVCGKSEKICWINSKAKNNRGCRQNWAKHRWIAREVSTLPLRASRSWCARVGKRWPRQTESAPCVIVASGAVDAALWHKPAHRVFTSWPPVTSPTASHTWRTNRLVWWASTHSAPAASSPPCSTAHRLAVVCSSSMRPKWPLAHRCATLSFNATLAMCASLPTLASYSGILNRLHPVCLWNCLFQVILYVYMFLYSFFFSHPTLSKQKNNSCNNKNREINFAKMSTCI